MDGKALDEILAALRRIEWSLKQQPPKPTLATDDKDAIATAVVRLMRQKEEVALDAEYLVSRPDFKAIQQEKMRRLREEQKQRARKTAGPPNGVEARKSESLLTTKEASGVLSTAEQTLRKWRCVGMGPKFVKVGRSIRYRQSDLDEVSKQIASFTGR